MHSNTSIPMSGRRSTRSWRKRQSATSPWRRTWATTTRPMSDMSQRVQRMRQHGVRLCLMQGADNMLENFARPLLSEIRDAKSRRRLRLPHVTPSCYKRRGEDAIVKNGKPGGAAMQRSYLQLALVLAVATFGSDGRPGRRQSSRLPVFQDARGTDLHEEAAGSCALYRVPHGQ